MPSGPSAKRKREPRKPQVFVPHPDDAAEVQAAFEAVERGELLSAEESAAYVRSLLTGEDEPPEK